MRYELTKWPSDPALSEGRDFDSLQARLLALSPDEQFQLWMYKPNGEMACVLANQTRAYLQILSDEPEAPTSLDPDFHGSDDETFEKIYLENGQLDEMGRSHCIPRDQAIAAGLHYFQTGTKSPLVAWC